jgi:hypothetical protein
MILPAITNLQLRLGHLDRAVQRLVNRVCREPPSVILFFLCTQDSTCSNGASRNCRILQIAVFRRAVSESRPI